MEIILTPAAKANIADVDEWKKSNDKKVLQCIRKLIQSIQQTLFECIGKPVPLK